jgi:hypothetical protein
MSAGKKSPIMPSASRRTTMIAKSRFIAPV